MVIQNENNIGSGDLSGMLFLLRYLLSFNFISGVFYFILFYLLGLCFVLFLFSLFCIFSPPFLYCLLVLDRDVGEAFADARSIFYIFYVVWWVMWVCPGLGLLDMWISPLVEIFIVSGCVLVIFSSKRKYYAH